MRHIHVLLVLSSVFGCAIDEAEPDSSELDQPYCEGNGCGPCGKNGCLPSCGEAGGNTCDPDACLGGYQRLDSWDCEVCCVWEPDECQPEDTRCDGSELIWCDRNRKPFRFVRWQCEELGYRTCAEWDEDEAYCSR